MTPQPNPKRVRVTGAKLPTYWYADKIGQEFDVSLVDRLGDFVIRLGDSRTRFIKPEDCIIVDPPANAPTQAPDIFVNVVEFTARPDGYGCRTPGDRSGKYVTLADAERLAAAPARLQADLLVYRQLVGARDGQIESLRKWAKAWKASAKSYRALANLTIENHSKAADAAEFYRNGIIEALTQRDEAKARVAELEAGQKLDASIFLEMFVQIISATSDAAIIANQDFHGGHVLSMLQGLITDYKSTKQRTERLAAALNPLKKNLGNDGDYSISRSDRKPMSLPETIFWGDLFEKIDAALAAAPAPLPERYLTVWKSGDYKVWRQGDAYYAQNDPDWFAEFNLTDLMKLPAAPAETSEPGDANPDAALRDAVIQAARVECAKFRFPDEDRPGLWDALQALDALKGGEG